MVSIQCMISTLRAKIWYHTRQRPKTTTKSRPAPNRQPYDEADGHTRKARELDSRFDERMERSAEIYQSVRS